ncbi:hypothetical protein V8G61_02755 [Gaetbulibacter sp. M240]|uniref:hypothetical protein n=1 Tax=Gaetbulibacter sp. M240 TaxID=3126511 RepID=UPI00374FADB2
MRTHLKRLFFIPFFALLFLTSCQDEVTDIMPPNSSEALLAESQLTNNINATAIMDGSFDNIIDRASCLSVELPITVIVKGLEIRIDSKEDFIVIERIFKEFDNDEDILDIIFPITIIKANHERVVIESKEALRALAVECRGENEPDDDIECIDFVYPLTFSIYNANFQVIETVTIENDARLYHFIQRVKRSEVFASLNFPVTMKLADGTEIVVNNNQQLQQTIEEAKDACDEDDDNDYGDDDFTLERLNTVLTSCPWVVYQFERNQDDLVEVYREYVVVFREDGVVKVKARNGDMYTGTWTTEVTDAGALISLQFDALTDFNLQWHVYDLDEGRIKLFQEGGNRVILKKHCDIIFEITKARIENYLQECLWRVARLQVDGIDNESDYIGTPLKFFADNVVKIRVNGEFVQGTYQVLPVNNGFVLQITLDGRPNLQLEWFVTVLEPGIIKLQALGRTNSDMVLRRFCPSVDGDINYINDILISNHWEVTKYYIVEGQVNNTENYAGYNIQFLESGHIKVTDPNNGLIDGSWLAYRNEGLFLGMNYGIEPPFEVLNHRWKIAEVSETEIVLHDFYANGEISRILILKVKV